MRQLCIDTAIDKASFCISDGLEILAFDKNEIRNEQAGWLHAAIKSAFRHAGVDMQSLDAIAVSNGPGSYTGLRIGLASAKGFCYALKKPLICLNTLQIIAGASLKNAKELVCPMIDARRMEVFTGLFTKQLDFYKEPFATELNADSFSDILDQHQILFSGNGSRKFADLIRGKKNAIFEDIQIDAKDMIEISLKEIEEKKTADVIYCEPYYVKNVYITNTKNM